jgi:hypothetical protein
MYIVSPQQQWLHEHASILHYTYTVCLVRLKPCLLNIFHFFTIGNCKRKHQIALCGELVLDEAMGLS